MLYNSEVEVLPKLVDDSGWVERDCGEQDFKSRLSSRRHVMFLRSKRDRVSLEFFTRLARTQVTLSSIALTSTDTPSEPIPLPTLVLSLTTSGKCGGESSSSFRGSMLRNLPLVPLAYNAEPCQAGISCSLPHYFVEFVHTWAFPFYTTTVEMDRLGLSVGQKTGPASLRKPMSVFKEYPATRHKIGTDAVRQ